MEFSEEEQLRSRRLLSQALRSGEYEQGKGYLKVQNEDGVKYCCLGVACEIFRDQYPGVLKEKTAPIGSFPCQTFGLEEHSGVLPKVVSEWLGFWSQAGSFSPSESLTGLNDVGVGFSEIAQIIDQEPGLLLTRI